MPGQGDIAGISVAGLEELHPELELARHVIDTAARGLADLRDSLDATLLIAARHLAGCRGRLVFAGMGKSGIAARKIASTFASLGKPSLFLHPADAAHGDLGKLCAGDVFLPISVSGETRALQPLLHYAREQEILTIAITARPDGALALQADIVLLLPHVAEGGPIPAVPMASTIATIALGDALATLVASRNQFGSGDLAVLHPGGRIGQRLRLLRTLMHAGERMPLVLPDTTAAEVIAEITRKGFGIAGVTDPDNGRLIGVVTDGDLRRHHRELGTALARDLMHTPPVTLPIDETADHALDHARAHRVTAIFLVDPVSGAPCGLVDLQDLLRVSID